VGCGCGRSVVVRNTCTQQAAGSGVACCGCVSRPQVCAARGAPAPRMPPPQPAADAPALTLLFRCCTGSGAAVCAYSCCVCVCPG
jgi:hypothetical protein